MLEGRCRVSVKGALFLVCVCCCDCTACAWLPRKCIVGVRKQWVLLRLRGELCLWARGVEFVLATDSENVSGRMSLCRYGCASVGAKGRMSPGVTGE